MNDEPRRKQRNRSFIMEMLLYSMVEFAERTVH